MNDLVPTDRNVLAKLSGGPDDGLDAWMVEHFRLGITPSPRSQRE